MARGEMKEIVYAKLREIQEDNDGPIWISGIQMTQLLKAYNPSSVRMALLLLVDDDRIIRERRKGRGGKGMTGQSSWYMAIDEIAESSDDIKVNDGVVTP